LTSKARPARIGVVKKLKLTTKRQVTFPAEVCETLGLEPGDEVALDSRVCEGNRVWVLAPVKRSDRSWMGALARYAEGREHSLDAVRKSIIAHRLRGGAKRKGGRS
jgi:bifunctional DNA-binding transcriptional regulator/antitoxin component of YhaV-PrlF toxin-antitoxin module